jgi:hypothetical protein
MNIGNKCLPFFTVFMIFACQAEIPRSETVFRNGIVYQKGDNKHLPDLRVKSFVLIREVLKLLGISENLMSRVQQPGITSTDEDAVNDSEALFSSGLKLFWT